MDKRLRVMIVTPEFGFGGAERSVAAIARLLSESHDLHTVVFNQHTAQVYPFGGSMHSLDVPGGQSVAGKILNFLKRVIKLRALKRKLKVDVSLSFLEGADYVNVLSRQHEKIVINIRGSKTHDPNIKGLIGWFRLRILVPWLYARAHAFTAVSDGLKRELIKNYKVPSQALFPVIPNYYDFAELLSNSNETLPPGWEHFLRNRHSVITVGRLAQEKGFDRFARVFKNLAQDEEVVWLIVGEGPARSGLIQLLRELDLPFSVGSEPDPLSKVFFLGYQSNPLRWVKRSRVFVLSSLTEGFPNALVEAMVVGIPVVATDCPYGPAEILTEGAGLLLPEIDDSSIDTWHDEINKLLHDSGSRSAYAEGSIKRVQDFSAERVREQWRNFLSKLTC